MASATQNGPFSSEEPARSGDESSLGNDGGSVDGLRAMLEPLFSRARGVGQGGSDLIGNLAATVRDNPVPVMLLAAGVASLIASERMSEGGRSRKRGRLDDWDDDGEHASRASALKSRARETAGELSERASELSERAKEKGEALRERMRGTISQVRERSTRTFEEEPLVVVGLGIALGALLGAGLPVTERERRTLGPARERVLERAREAAREGAERVREGAERVKSMVERAGASAETAPGEREQDDDDDAETDERMES
jgi:hypothetical protein